MRRFCHFEPGRRGTGNCYFLALLLGGAVTATGQVVQSLVVPADSVSQDGNSSSNIPFILGAARYQQVYLASEFPSLTELGGGWIRDIFLRGDGMNGKDFGVDAPSVQINLSTTPRGPDELSSVFAENPGSDDTVVFARGQFQAFGLGDRDGTPQPFTFLLNLTQTFYYNPSAGNLLLDIRIFQGDDYSNPDRSRPTLDAWDRAGDSVSRVHHWWDVNSATGEVSTVGLVTRFEFLPNPQLSVQETNGTATLTWPANPGVFVLQSTEQLSAQAVWTDITNGIVTTNGLRHYTLIPSAAELSAFFRLVSMTNSSPP